MLLAITIGVVALSCGGSNSSGVTAERGIGIFSETPPLLHPDVDTFIGTFSDLGGAISEFEQDTHVNAEGASSLCMTARATGVGYAGYRAGPCVCT
jgi:hypothetical protein